MKQSGTFLLLALCLWGGAPRTALGAMTEAEAETASVRFFHELSEPDTDDQGQPLLESDGKPVMRTERSYGSGFIISEDGYVATNEHVVAGATKLWVSHKEGSRVVIYTVDLSSVWSSKYADVAVVHCPGLRHRPLTLSFFEPAKGTPVYTVGYPGVADEEGPRHEVFLLLAQCTGEKTDVTDLLAKDPAMADVVNPSITHGQVTRFTLHRGYDEGVDQEVNVKTVECNVKLGHGNSGGPLVNASGEVIGIVGRVGIDWVHIGFKSYWAMSILELKDRLEGQHIAFVQSKEPFVLRTLPQISAYPPGIVWAVSAASGMALLALLLGWFRSRKAEACRPGITTLVDEKLRLELEARRSSPMPPKSPAKDPLSQGKGRSTWLLTGHTTDGQTVRLEISESLLSTGKLVIGRTAGPCHLEVKDPSISKQHAQIRRNGAGFVVADLQSANGTAVNGRYGQPANEELPLRAGDTLTLGEVKLQFTQV